MDELPQLCRLIGSRGPKKKEKTEYVSGEEENKSERNRRGEKWKQRASVDVGAREGWGEMEPDGEVEDFLNKLSKHLSEMMCHFGDWTPFLIPPCASVYMHLFKHLSFEPRLLWKIEFFDKNQHFLQFMSFKWIFKRWILLDWYIV